MTSCHLQEPQSVWRMHGICALAVIVTFASTACSVKKFAISKLADSLASQSTSSFATDDDPELIGDALPFALKLMDGLLDQVPQHRGLLFATSSGTQYSYVWVQQPADEVEQKDVAQAKQMRLRARNLYLRARDYGIRGLALWDAKWELLMPVVALVALFSGFATPVEASALTALYAFLTEAVIHRDLQIFRDAPRVMSECGLLIGGVLLILGVSLGFTNYLVDAEVPTRAVEWTTRNIHSSFLFLLLLNGFMVVVGCLLEIYPAIVIEVPLLVPLGAAYGIDPIRLGIIFLANLELGYLTPPVGLNLLMSSYRFHKPVGEVLRSALPVVAVLSMGVLLITYIPGLTTLLPRLFGY